MAVGFPLVSSKGKPANRTEYELPPGIKAADHAVPAENASIPKTTKKQTNFLNIIFELLKLEKNENFDFESLNLALLLL